jgi:transglutaminase/protease-like cytokinesis protein 3
MNIRLLLLILLGFCIQATAQKTVVQNPIEYASVDNLMLKIPDTLTTNTTTLAGYINSNFHNPNDKSRAIFCWITHNIQYDLDNMFAINFYQSNDELIDMALKTHKGICMHYATLFTDLAIKTGIPSVVISGYTKQNGFVDYIPHAWCGALIDSTWLLFDPTWGSGFIQNKKFITRTNNYYYKTKPEQLIKSHIPFDPLWEFLNYPVTNKEFYAGQTEVNTAKPHFSFIDTLQTYEKKSEIDKLVSSTERIEKNGISNSLIYDRLQHNRREIEYQKSKINAAKTDQYNVAVHDYNDAVNLLNEFIKYRNKQFTPVKTDPDLKQMLDTVGVELNKARTQLQQTKDPDPNLAGMIPQLNKMIDDLEVGLNEQKTFLNKYLVTPKLFRKGLFAGYVK